MCSGASFVVFGAFSCRNIANSGQPFVSMSYPARAPKIVSLPDYSENKFKDLLAPSFSKKPTGHWDRPNQSSSFPKLLVGLR
jgi:hypothetical protein